MVEDENGTAEKKLNVAVLILARLIGRQIARETFEQLNAANNN